MKLLLYCTKAKPYLYPHFNNLYFTKNKDFGNVKLNGKIVAECDYEVEEITYAPNPSAFERANFSPKEWGYDYQEKYGGLSNEELLKHSCLTNKELSDYLNTPKNDKKTFCKDTFGYAIHIKNLHIFDKPRGLSDCYKKYGGKNYSPICYMPITNAPQNMMRVWLHENGKWVMYILISIQSQWMCLILNRIKDVEVRRAVLKEMLKNE